MTNRAEMVTTRCCALCNHPRYRHEERGQGGRGHCEVKKCRCARFLAHRRCLPDIAAFLKLMKKLSFKELADKAGISFSHCWCISVGERKPGQKVAQKLAAAMGVSLEKLFQVLYPQKAEKVKKIKPGVDVDTEAPVVVAAAEPVPLEDAGPEESPQPGETVNA